MWFSFFVSEMDLGRGMMVLGAEERGADLMRRNPGYERSACSLLRCHGSNRSCCFDEAWWFCKMYLLDGNIILCYSEREELRR